MRIRNYKNLHQITFLPHIFPINSYVYEEQSSLTLIDIGVPFLCKAVMRLSKSLGKPVDKIVITHPHQDHVGGLDAIKKHLPDAAVYISKRDYALLQGDFTIHEDEEQSEINGGFYKTATAPDKLVENGDYIGALKVLSTPGHTPGSISLYDENAGILIVGDAIQVRGGLSVAGDKRLLFPFPAMATWSKKSAADSAEKLCKLDITVLGSGHGRMIEDPKAKMEQVLARAERKLDIG